MPSVEQTLRQHLDASKPLGDAELVADQLLLGAAGFPVDEHLVAELEQLVLLGARAQQALSAVQQELRRRTEQQRRTEIDQALAPWISPDLAAWGLIRDTEGWSWPGRVGVRAQLLTVEPDRWERNPVLAHVQVSVHDVAVGVVCVHADAQVSVHGTYAAENTFRATELLSRTRVDELVQSSPWTQFDFASLTTPPDGIAALAGVGDQVLAWVEAMGNLLAEAERVEADRAEQEKVWRALSRTGPMRLPTAALKKWMDTTAHVTHDSTGYPVDGWRPTLELLVGQVRPSFLDSNRRHKAVGVKEVVQLGRIVQHNVRYSRTGSLAGVKFYDSEIEKLRQALTGYLVEVTEDRLAVFVAVDAPAVRLELDAALVEWVLLNS